MRPISVPISVGELVDKITILEIKLERMRNAIQLANVGKELALLSDILNGLSSDTPEVEIHKTELKRINEELWEIEDEIRVLERDKNFGDRFVELARAVYVTNDRRAAVKKTINAALGSELTEEKSYADYQGKKS